MKTIHFLSLLTAVAFLTGFTPPVAKKLPNVTITDLQGKPVNIVSATSSNKITVISFWATWCSPCKRELDAIADLYPDWQSDLEVELIAITIDNARALTQVKPLLEEKGWPYTILVDSKQELQQALGFQAIPQTFVIDHEGTIVYQHEGYTPGDEYELEKFLKTLANK